MNKLSFSLAFAALVPLALLSACSDEKSSDPTHTELCAGGVTNDCLVGRWKFERVSGSFTGIDYCDGYSGSLTLGAKDENGNYPFSFTNDVPGLSPELKAHKGTWTLEGNTITINASEAGYRTDGTVAITNGGANMTITKTGTAAAFSLCSVKFVEEFTYIGN